MDLPFPSVSTELLETLTRLFPERSADPAWTDREVWIKSGECNVVRLLRAKFDEQNETIIQR